MTSANTPGRRRPRTPVVAGIGALALVSTLTAGPAAHADASSAGGARAAAPAVRPMTATERGTDAYLTAIRRDPGALRTFFRQLPKGGDLHNHLSGAVTPEYLIGQATQDGLCIETATMTAVAPPCGPGARPAADARRDRAFHDAIVRAWSMQDFPADGNGHDHFFDAFGKFGEVTWRHRGEQLAQVANTAAAQHQFYVETMVTPASDEAKKLADAVGWDDDFAALHHKLVAGGRLDRVIARARQEADDADTEFRATAHCGTARAEPACRLPVRWVSQVSRGSAPERVFTQMAVGMRLAERDRRFVAINLVQPEDGERALRDYRLQMRMLKYLRGVYPKAHVTLHAGELWPGLVKPQELKFHIQEAVDVAGAERIGHGVDLVHEDRWQRTARTMADREIPVEVPLTSNAQILGVRGAAHPFATYRAFGVPVVLSTDDPGISRTDISHEYAYAARTYGLSYAELKDLARASLKYGFLPGADLWRGNPTRDGYRTVDACGGVRPGSPAPGAECRRLLDASPKAAAEWRQEGAFQRFERSFRR
ncbi:MULTISPECIES: adenosine deaminase family protein [Streptomyces]|uniref:adenosine deaminase n=1 Tax=Streptomyces ramulosus TaxID=47762 RepID=A0ABW1FVZ1_9ACTN